MRKLSYKTSCFLNIKALLFLLVIQFSCSSTPALDEIIDSEGTELAASESTELATCDNVNYNYNNESGCDGKAYPDPSSSPYVIPFPPKTVFNTGLTNCSSSYHGAQYPDRYAFDFDVPVGTNFYASRGGTVVYVVESQSSSGGGSGNWVVLDHNDATYGIYLHSPKNGISVNVGDIVNRGDLLGVTGRSGLAGYPHLHFIVVQNGYQWPYDPIPITFKNIVPSDVIVKSYTTYQACEY